MHRFNSYIHPKCSICKTYRARNLQEFYTIKSSMLKKKLKIGVVPHAQSIRKSIELKRKCEAFLCESLWCFHQSIAHCIKLAFRICS